MLWCVCAWEEIQRERVGKKEGRREGERWVEGEGRGEEGRESPTFILCT